MSIRKNERIFMKAIYILVIAKVINKYNICIN